MFKATTLLNLIKYKTPSNYFLEFREAFSYINVRQVRLLSTAIFLLAAFVRTIGHIFYTDMITVPNIMEYNLCNLTQLIGSSIFILLSSLALKFKGWSSFGKDLLTVAFAIFILSVSFYLSYIYSLHNAKNTLTLFLVGIVIVSIFFSLELGISFPFHCL